MPLGESIFLLEKAGGGTQSGPYSHACQLGDSLHWRELGICIPFGNVWVWCAQHKGYPDLCWSKTGEKQPGKSRLENYIQEQVLFSGKDTGIILCAMYASLEDETLEG